MKGAGKSPQRISLDRTHRSTTSLLHHAQEQAARARCCTALLTVRSPAAHLTAFRSSDSAVQRCLVVEDAYQWRSKLLSWCTYIQLHRACYAAIAVSVALPARVAMYAPVLHPLVYHLAAAVLRSCTGQEQAPA